MLYTAHGKDFKHHVHPTLQRRLRLFFMLAFVMLLLAVYDIYNGTLNIWIALISIVIGSGVGLITSRIFNLSWEKDGARVVGRIDAIGWVILVAYLIFEIARATILSDVIHVSVGASTAITYMFVASALITRVFGLRGRMIKILKDEKIFD